MPISEAILATWSPPAGVAMEMVTHIARRSLLAGPAGGFADTITAQTLLPGVASALAAARVIHQALDDRDPQVALAAYDQAWQDQLAKHLSPPSTPLSLLLPLVFVNPRILSRFTAAVLRGQDI
jgi:flavin-dependent dehydrogenase